MSDIYKYLNIRNIDIETAIKESIGEVRRELKGLNEGQMCLVFTSYIYCKLRERHVVARMVDTRKDLGLDYTHYFVTVPKSDEESFVIDLTYSQFGYDDLFEDMYSDGYQLLSVEEYSEYIDGIIRSTNRGR